MADNDCERSCQDNLDGRCFKEAVCIDAYRVYDSCADKDCLECLRVYFTENGQKAIDQACSVRMRKVDVCTVHVDLEPLAFHKGFYSVDMTFFFEVSLDVFLSPAAIPVSVCGISIFNKKVILYGSEGNVKIYSSGYNFEDLDRKNSPVKNLPKATVQVAEPIGLSAKLCEIKNRCEPECRIPACICRKHGGEFCSNCGCKTVYATIGLFTIVQIERNVQMLIPSYDFCIPEKECITTSDNPCELFSKIDFPTSEFFPPKITDLGCDTSSCGCSHKKS